MFHTAFASNKAEAQEKYAAMKAEIGSFLEHYESGAASQSKGGNITSRLCKEFMAKF